MAVTNAQAHYDRAVAVRGAEIKDRLAQIFPGRSNLSRGRSVADLPPSEFKEEAEALLAELGSYGLPTVKQDAAVEASSREMDIALAKTKPGRDVAAVSAAFKRYRKAVRRRIAEIETRIDELESNKGNSHLFSSDPEENRLLEGEYANLKEELQQLRNDLESYKKKRDIVQIQAAIIVGGTATVSTESCSPFNGTPDPDETVTVSFCVRNTGGPGMDTVNLVGTLQATGGVTSPSGPQNYGAVPGDGLTGVCRNFTFIANGTCGGTLTASIQFQDGANNLGTVTYTFQLGVTGPPVSRTFIFSPGVTIPDNTAAGVNIPFVVNSVGQIADLNFRIDGTSCDTMNPSLTVCLKSWCGG